MMLAISTAGCRSSVSEYTSTLYQNGLFKNFEYMADDNIFVRDLMQVVSLCMQPKLQKENFGHALSSQAENDRSSYLLYLHSKIKTAIHYKCKNIVLWPGYVPIHKDIDKDFAIHRGDTTVYIQNICRSIFSICKNFPQLNFCIPPARTFYEIPATTQEMLWILEDVKCPNLKYWHNTSSSLFLEKQGFEPQESWLENLGSYTHGIHYEDVVGDEPMCPPGMGEIDFSKIKVPNALKVLRISEQFGNFGIQTALDILHL